MNLRFKFTRNNLDVLHREFFRSIGSRKQDGIGLGFLVHKIAGYMETSRFEGELLL